MEPNGPSEVGPQDSFLSNQTPCSLAHLRPAKPTSISSINKHPEGISSVPGWGEDWDRHRRESAPLPALFKSKLGERRLCAHGCQMLSTGLSYCHRAPSLGLARSWGGTGIPWQRSLLLSTSGSHLLFFGFTSLLIILLFVFAFSQQPLVGVGSFSHFPDLGNGALGRPYKIRVTIPTAFPRTALPAMGQFTGQCLTASFQSQRCAHMEDESWGPL